MPGPGARDREKMKSLKARIKEMEANAAARAADRTADRTDTRSARVPRDEGTTPPPKATVAQGDREPFVEEAESDMEGRRAGARYARQVEEDDAATSLEADTRAFEKQRPVAVQRTRDRDSIDYPDDKSAGGFVFSGPQYGAEEVKVGGAGGPVYMPGAPQRAVEGLTSADVERQVAAYRERLRAPSMQAQAGQSTGGKSRR